MDEKSKFLTDLARGVGNRLVPEQEAAFRQSFERAKQAARHVIAGSALTDYEIKESNKIWADGFLASPRDMARGFQLLKKAQRDTLASTQARLARQHPDDFEAWREETNDLSYKNPIYNEDQPEVSARPVSDAQAAQAAGPEAAAALRSTVPTTVKIPPLGGPPVREPPNPNGPPPVGGTMTLKSKKSGKVKTLPSERARMYLEQHPNEFELVR